MSDQVLKDCRYTQEHEWISLLENGEAIVGISDHAQEKLGDIVFVELPEEGREVAGGESLAVIESVKAASDAYSPIEGTVSSVNTDLEDNPGLINSDPYGDGYLVKLSEFDEKDLDDLMTADEYKIFIAED